MNKRSAIVISLIAVLAVVAVMITVYVMFGQNEQKAIPVDDTVSISQDDQREIYYDAMGRLDSIGNMRYRYTCSQRFTFPDSVNEELVTADVQFIGRGGEEPEYYARFNNGDEDFICAYSDGVGYSDESGAAHRSAMSETDFADYLSDHMLDDSDTEFETVTVTELEGGGYSCTASGADKLPESLADALFILGAEDVKIGEYNKTAQIDKLGRLSGQTTYIKLSMKRWGKPVGCEVSCVIDYDSVGERFTMDAPDAEGYTDIGDIRGSMLMLDAYDSFYSRSYTSDYTTSFVCRDGDQEYSIKLGYSGEVTQDKAYTADDTTNISYKTRERTSDTERTTSFSDGVLAITENGEAFNQEIDTDTARSTYYYLLTDHRPNISDISSVTVTDRGDTYEIEYLYTDDAARKLCQTVLTTVGEDDSGMAVNSDNYSIKAAKGNMTVGKENNTLLRHEISVSAEFDEKITVSFDHALNMSIT